MNREQRLEMLGRLAEVPSVELKMNIPADQRSGPSGLDLDAMRGRLREVFLKVEMGVPRGADVVSASLKGVRKAGAVRRAVTGDRPLERLFTKEQRAFFADHAPPGVGWDDLVPLGPVLVVLLKCVPKGLPNKTTIQQWHYPGQVPLVELSTKATPQNVLEVFAGAVKFVQGHGLSATGPQQPKTRKAPEFFARTHPSR
ncbi:MAG TPA: hypothetical protein VJB61_13390 [Actinomycetota bacterium]